MSLDNVLGCRCYKNRAFVGLANGKVEVYTRIKGKCLHVYVHYVIHCTGSTCTLCVLCMEHYIHTYMYPLCCRNYWCYNT